MMDLNELLETPFLLEILVGVLPKLTTASVDEKGLKQKFIVLAEKKNES